MNQLLLKVVPKGLTVLSILLATATMAQEKNTIKYGKVSMDELTMPVYKLDSSANAVVLSDVGSSYFQYNNNEDQFEIVYQRHTRIKVFNKAGYDAATVTIPYYNSIGQVKEKVMSIKGVTYLLENGKIVEYKLDSKSIFDEKTNENWSRKKITLPNVKEGAVFEISYTINSNYLFAFPDWKFQGQYPIVWSEYSARIPEYFKYKQAMQGYEQLTVNEQKQSQESFSIKYSGGFVGGGFNTQRVSGGFETVNATTINYRWAMKNVPAFKDEKFITTDDDYIAKMEFQLTGTQYPNQAFSPILSSWESINEKLLFNENLGSQLNRSGFAKDALKAIEANYSDPFSRIMAVNKLVKKNVTWNGMNSIYSLNGIKEAYEKKTGNSADINLMLISFLREVGLKADPVILSTRSHGRIKEFNPLLDDFNSVIACVKVDTLELLLDGTNPFLPVHLLPKQCLNGSGRLVTKGEGKWIELEGRHAVPRKLIMATAAINSEGILKGNLAISEQLYDASGTRSALAATASQEEYVKKMFTSDALKINKYSFENVDRIDTLLVTKLELEGEQLEMSDMIYLNPYLLYSMKENPFKAKERKFPVSYTVPENETYMLTFEIPNGYLVEELPKSSTLVLPEGSAKFTYQAAQNGEKIQIRSVFSINKTMFLPDEYQDLKEFYNLVIAKQAEQIVLKKNGVVNTTGK